MISNRAYSKLFCNLIIAGLLSAGDESINSASIENAQSMNKPPLQRSKRALNSLEQEGSAEYSFFLLLFDLTHRLDTDIEYSATFSEEVKNVATGAINQRTLKIRDFDKVVNGKGSRINWTKVNPIIDDSNYSNVLEGVKIGGNFLTEQESETHVRAARRTEIERLREFAQGVIEYHSLFPASDDRAQTIKIWKQIVGNLDRSLSEPERFPDWNNKAPIDLYKA